MGIIKRNFANNILSSGTFDATKLTGDIPAGNLSANAPAFDDNKVVNDLATLGLRVHTQNNLNASNTNSQFVDVFNDASGIDTTTNAVRNASEYISTIYDVPEDTTINLGTEISSGWSGYDSGVVAGTATNLVNDNWDANYVSWSVRAGNADPSVATGDVGEFGTYCSLYKATTFNIGAVRFWSGHGNGADPLGAKDVAIYTSTDTTDGSNGTWSIVTPRVFEPTTDNSANMRNRGQRTSPISSNHFILSSMVNSNNSTVPYSDTVAFWQLTGIKGVRFDIRTSWNNGIYGNEKPHITQVQIFDDGGVADAISAANATGDFTSTTITAPSTVSSMGAVITYQDNAGTNALNTDIVLQLSADGGSNYTTATLEALPDFSSGIKMAKVNDLAIGTPGTQLKYKILFANQSSGVKEARIRGVSLNY